VKKIDSDRTVPDAGSVSIGRVGENLYGRHTDKIINGLTPIFQPPPPAK